MGKGSGNTRQTANPIAQNISNALGIGSELKGVLETNMGKGAVGDLINKHITESMSVLDTLSTMQIGTLLEANQYDGNVDKVVAKAENILNENARWYEHRVKELTGRAKNTHQQAANNLNYAAYQLSDTKKQLQKKITPDMIAIQDYYIQQMKK